MSLTKKQSTHLSDICVNIQKRISDKYRNGQKEHGGDLWEKSGMMDNALDEVADLVTYLHTLRSQLEEVRALLKRERYPSAITSARLIIEKILNKPNG